MALKLSRTEDMTEVITEINVTHTAAGTKEVIRVFLFDDVEFNEANITTTEGVRVAQDSGGAPGSFTASLDITLEPNTAYTVWVESDYISSTPPIVTINGTGYTVIREIVEEVDPPTEPVNNEKVNPSLVIEHLLTGYRYMYPKLNINKETETGFVQTQYVPREFKISEDQTPVNMQYFATVNYPAQPKDPIDQYNWRDRIW